MEKRSFLSLLRYPLIVLAVSVIALIVGSFADLSISRSLYKGTKTIFTLASYITPIGGLIVMASSGVFLFLYYKNAREKTKKVLSYFALLLAPLAGLAYGAIVLTSLSTLMALLAGAFLGIIAGLLVYWLLRKKDPKQFFVLGYFFLFASITVILFCILLNKAIVRPTYSMLLLTDEAGTDYAPFYRDWFLFSVDKTGYPEDLATSYYASFPTLSTGIASLGLLLPSFCPLFKKGKNKEIIVFVCAALLILVDGALNIMVGKAFLSDFAFALLIGAFPLFLIHSVTVTPKSVEIALLHNLEKETHGLKASLRKGFRYGVGARRFYDEQISPSIRKSIRKKNNRAAKKNSSGPFFKLNRNR